MNCRNIISHCFPIREHYCQIQWIPAFFPFLLCFCRLYLCFFPLGKGKHLSLLIFLLPFWLFLSCFFGSSLSLPTLQMAVLPKFCPWLSSLPLHVSTGIIHALPCLQPKCWWLANPCFLARAPNRRIPRLLRVSDSICLSSKLCSTWHILSSPFPHPLQPNSDCTL